MPFSPRCAPRVATWTSARSRASTASSAGCSTPRATASSCGSRRRGASANSAVKLSFVVPAHNEEALLGATLAALDGAGRACGCAYEIVVVDDGSTDGTAQVATAAGARVVRIARRQISASRNAGARAATVDALVFVDADTIVSPAVVRAVLAALESGAAGGGATV